MEEMYYVYAYDKIWKDWICCECKSIREAIYVKTKWEGFKDRKNVGIETFINPSRKATMYEVRETGWIGLKKEERK